MAKFGFDVSSVAPDTGAGSGSYDPIPEGEYTLRALEAEQKTTAKGDGTYIKVKFEVARGEHEGRLMWQNFNVTNPNEKAEQIGRAQLVAWATACGRPEADNTDKLLDRPFKATVTIEKGKNGYADSNRIKAFLFDAGAAAESKPAAKPAAKTAAPAAAAKGANPWD